MLNKDNQRELAYLVKIDDICPITGSDNCECAVVGGWHVMVRKGTFKKSDVAIYFEIDSLVDLTRPEFAFMSKYKGRVKTQKYTFGGKGLMISQGLLMHPNDLGWLPVRDEDDTVCGVLTNTREPVRKVDDESRFVTELLNVHYYDPEDEKRKKEPKDKVPQMPKFFRTKLGRWLMRHTFTRKLCIKLFGKKKKKKNWPEWVAKTDEERCLIGQTKLHTDRGLIQIDKIVNQKLPVRVLSVNEEGEFEYKPIIGYQKLPIGGKRLITIGYSYKPGTSRLNHICCTNDHEILTSNGYVKAEDLKLGDLVVSKAVSYGEEALPAIYGMLLGDSNISKDKRSAGNIRICHTNGERQYEYLLYKKSLFDESDGKIYNAGIGSFGKVPSYHFIMDVDPVLSDRIKDDWNIKDKKRVTDKVLKRLTWESLAFWYMDDGWLNKVGAEFIKLNTQGFTFDEVHLLSAYIKDRFGIKNSVYEDKKNGKTYPVIRISHDGTLEFLKNVTPYMCKAMAYKTLPEFESLIETSRRHYEKKEQVFFHEVKSVEFGQKKSKTIAKNIGIVYDITVEDNHNFVADGIVVHNCQNIPWIIKDEDEWICTEKIDGTSTTVSVKRKGKKFESYICSRNVVFDKPDKDCFYDTNVYVEMAEKYHLVEFLESYLKEHKDIEWATIQGETYGDKIQNRTYSLKDERRFAGFNFIDSVNGRLGSVEAKELAEKYDIPWVPIVDENFKMPETVDELLEMATGESVIDGLPREGFVFRSKDGKKSFKAVSNEFLLKYHN